MRLSSVYGLFALALCGVVQPGYAQQIVEATPPQAFDEVYDPVPDTSGGQLLGLSVAGDAGHLRGSGPLFLETAGAGTRVCVRVHTRDGRYRATNPFTIPVASANWVRIGALSEQYRSELDGYGPGEVAVRSYLTMDGSCSPQDALNIPMASDPERQPSQLDVQINSGGLSVSASLYLVDVAREPDKAEPAAIAECVEAGAGARIAYNTVCRFDIAGLKGGPALLRIDFEDGFDPESMRVRLLLPGAGGR